MILEQLVTDVSNRFSTAAAKVDSSYQEIKAAVKDTFQLKDQEEIFPEGEVIFEDEFESLREQYGLLENLDNVNIDYESLFSYLGNQPLSEENYHAAEEAEEKKESGAMSAEEAEETVQQIQLSYLLGDKDNVSYETKERFQRWQEYNKTLLMLYHQLSPIKSDNIDYSRLN